MAQWRALPRDLRLFLYVTVGLGLVCAACELVSAFVLHLDGLYTWPTLPFHDCTDLRCFIPRFEHFHQLDFFSDAPDRGLTFGYPAPGAVLYEFFYVFGPHPFIFFFVVTLAGVAGLLWLIARQMRRELLPRWVIAVFLATSVVFSYPLWFEYLLANMEICIFLLVAAGVLAFLGRQDYLAATCFALAGSVKIIPLVYLGLLLARRRYGPFFFGALLPVPLTVVSLWLVCPSIPLAQKGISDGLAKFHDAYMLTYRPAENGFDHSLFNLIKRFIAFNSSAQLEVGMNVYIGLAAFAGLILYFTRIRHLPVANQILCLATASVLLPPLSHDYTLLQLYLPWAMLAVLSLRAAHAGRRIAGLAATFLALAILLAPQTEFILYSESLGGPIKAVFLCGLMFLGLRYPFETMPPTRNETVRQQLAAV